MQARRPGPCGYPLSLYPSPQALGAQSGSRVPFLLLLQPLNTASRTRIYQNSQGCDRAVSLLEARLELGLGSLPSPKPAVAGLSGHHSDLCLALLLLRTLVNGAHVDNQDILSLSQR